jgi:hypothetical protein
VRLRAEPSGWSLRSLSDPQTRGIEESGVVSGAENVYPAGGFFPPVATKLTQSPWFLKTP